MAPDQSALAEADPQAAPYIPCPRMELARAISAIIAKLRPLRSTTTLDDMIVELTEALDDANTDVHDPDTVARLLSSLRIANKQVADLYFDYPNVEDFPRMQSVIIRIIRTLVIWKDAHVALNRLVTAITEDLSDD